MAGFARMDDTGKPQHQLPRRVCLFRDARRWSRVLCRIKSEWPMTVSILSSVVHHVPDREAGGSRGGSWAANIGPRMASSGGPLRRRRILRDSGKESKPVNALAMGFS
jgi:hypothetical protein